MLHSEKLGNAKSDFCKIYLAFIENLYESFKDLYLAILPVGIRWMPMKYHIKPLGMTKIQGFRQDIYGYDFLYS